MTCWICEGGCEACDWTPLYAWDTHPIHGPWGAPDDCPACDGDGGDWAGICPTCRGKGWPNEADHARIGEAA